MTQTPDLMPILSRGAHPVPADGACIMEYVSFLAGERWSDRPACTHPALATAAQIVNDTVSNEVRPRLLPLIPRLMGTKGNREAGLRLADWTIHRVARDLDWVASDLGVKRSMDTAVFARKGGLSVRQAVGHATMALAYGVHRSGDHHDDHMVDFLTDLLDEFDRLTSRETPAPLSTEDLHRCAVLTGAPA